MPGLSDEGRRRLPSGPEASGKKQWANSTALLASTLPQLVDGKEGRAWAAEHDRIDYRLLEQALAGLPEGEAAALSSG